MFINRLCGEWKLKRASGQIGNLFGNKLNAPQLLLINRADPRFLGALCPMGGGVFE